MNLSFLSEQVIVVFLVVQILWLLAISIILIQTVYHYRRLVGKNKKLDLKDVLETILNKIQKQEQESQNFSKRMTEVEKKNLKNFQKIGFLRFNPFSDTGGDQSFVLSLLDGEENGVILSSLHGRESTRLYGKAIKKGVGETAELSKEEQETIKRALRRKT